MFVERSDDLVLRNRSTPFAAQFLASYRLFYPVPLGASCPFFPPMPALYVEMIADSSAFILLALPPPSNLRGSVGEATGDEPTSSFRVKAVSTRAH